MEIVDAIKPRPDIKDYFGNLPLYNSLMKNDVQMIQRMHKKGKDYFNIRNFKNQTIFHIAAKNGAIESLQVLIDNMNFVEELLKKDYKGNTPLHTAAYYGKYQILEYFLTKGSKLMLDI